MVTVNYFDFKKPANIKILVFSLLIIGVAYYQMARNDIAISPWNTDPLPQPVENTLTEDPVTDTNVAPIKNIPQDPVQVYAAAFNDLFDPEKVQLLVIGDHISADASTGSVEETLAVLTDTWPELEGSTVAHFKQVNLSATPLLPGMKIGFNYELISTDQVSEIFTELGDKAWDTFYGIFRDSPGVTAVSGVGFNDEGDQALVYVGTQSSDTAGSGYYLLFSKEDSAGDTSTGDSATGESSTGDSAWVLVNKKQTW